MAKLDRFKGRIPSLFDNILRLKHLDQKAARQAIERPLDKFVERPSRPTTSRSGSRVVLVDEVLAKDSPPAGSPSASPGRTRNAGAGGPGCQRGDGQGPLPPARANPPLGGRGRREFAGPPLATYNGLGGAGQIVSRHLDDVILPRHGRNS